MNIKLVFCTNIQVVTYCEIDKSRGVGVHEDVTSDLPKIRTQFPMLFNCNRKN